MAKKKNVFNDATFKYLDTLVDLEFLTRALDQQTTNLHSTSKQALADWKAKRGGSGLSEKKILGVTSCLSIVNVFGKKYARLPYGHKSRHDDDMLKLIEEQGHRSQAQCVCMMYEAFEQFVKSFAPPLFYQQRKTWQPDARDAFHKKRPALAKVESKNTLPYFVDYVKYRTTHNCDQILKELKNKLLGFESSCVTDWFPDLFSIYRAVSCIRHTTVHTDGHPSDRATKQLQQWDREFIKAITRASTLTGKDTILPTATATAVLFEGMAGLGYCLYKTSSDLCGMAVRRPRK